MKTKAIRAASIFLALAILLSAGLVLPVTASAAGVGPADALQPSGDWAQLGAGESEWYAFYYAGDGSQIEVRLQAETQDSLGFTVWTPEEIERWIIGAEVNPIGRGADDPYTEGTLVWSGSFATAGTYYVVVEQDIAYAGTSHYQLEVCGDGISSSEPAAAPAPEPVTVQTEATEPTDPSGSAEPTGTLVFQTTYGGTFYTITLEGTGNADGGEQGSQQLQRITNGIDPVWSPNGEQIAYVRWEEPRGVWIVDVETGNEWRAFDWSETRYPSWSPDGSQIIFSRQYGVVPTPSRSAPSSTAGEPVDADASIMRGPPGGGGAGGAGSDTWNLGIINVWEDSFSEPQPDSTINLVPDWSPDGEQIVYSASQGLRVMSVDGKTSYALTQNPKDTSPTWSPDGTQVAFVYRQHDHWEIYVVDVTTGQQTRLTDTPIVDGVPANSVSPAWSPDGNYIAFLTDRSGEWEIWIMDSDGSDAQPLFDTELDGLTLDYAYAGERAIDWTW